MAVVMIGTIRQNSKSVIGVRLYDTENEYFKDVPINSVKAALSKGVEIENLGLQAGEVVGTNGSIDRYPVIIKGKLVGKSPLIVLNEVGDLGYDVVDWKGKKGRYKTEDVVAYSKKNGIANGKLVERDGKQFISSINGSYRRIEIESIIKEKEKEVAEQSTDESIDKPIEKEVKQATVENKEPVSKEPDKGLKDRLVNNKQGVNDEQTDKSKVRKNLRKRDIISSDGNSISIDRYGLKLPTINITNPYTEGLKLLDTNTGLTVEQKMARAALVIKKLDRFLFALYMNLYRVPVKEDIIQTMGVSLDTLYFNCQFVRDLPMGQLVFVIEHEMYHIIMKHTVRRGTRIAEVWNIATDLFINKLICDNYGIKPNDPVKMLAEDNYGVGIQFAEGGLYHPRTDVKKETVEGIYDELMKQYNDKRQQTSHGNGSTGEGGNSSLRQSMDGTGKGNQHRNEQSENGQAENGQGENGQVENEQDERSKRMSIVADIVYHGDKLGEIADMGKSSMDLIESSKDESMSDELKESKSNGLLQRALTHARQIGGHNESSLERLVEEITAPRIDWRTLLRAYLSQATKKENSFSRPDKRFISRNMIMPGPKPFDPDKIIGVKVCVDTSGSIGDMELGMVISQIIQLLRAYKAEAEMIYWDTAVRVTAPFTNKEELLKIRPRGGGGTDITCVFNYFDSKDCKVKPKIIVVFTDGAFSLTKKSAWEKKYKDIIWVIHGGDTSFKPPWGKKADFQVS